MTKQIKWALDVLNNGAWWDDIDDDASDADMNPLYDAIDTVNNTLERLTFCGECVYFNRITDTLGTCERCTEGTKTEDDFCFNGEVREEEK